MRICSVNGCDRQHEAHGLCALHYGRVRIGKPLERKITGGDAPNGATPVPGYERYYSATKDGRIFSNDYRRSGEPRELAQSTHPEGYKRVKAWFIEPRRGTAVHRLIALTFIPNPSNLPQVNHINSRKGDNRVENLEWCDNAWNQKHAFLNGKHIYPTGENHKLAKLSASQVEEIRRRLTAPKYKGQLMDIAKDFGVSNYCIFDIRWGRSWQR